MTRPLYLQEFTRPAFEEYLAEEAEPCRYRCYRIFGTTRPASALRDGFVSLLGHRRRVGPPNEFLYRTSDVDRLLAASHGL